MHQKKEKNNKKKKKKKKRTKIQEQKLTVSKGRHQPLHGKGAAVHEARSEALSPHEVAATKQLEVQSTEEKERKKKAKNKPKNTGIGGESSNGNANMLINLEHLLLIRRKLRGRTLFKEERKTFLIMKDDQRFLELN